MNAVSSSRVHGERRAGEPMSRHTSWRVGGPAQNFFRPADIDDLKAFLQDLDEDTSVFWHGVGSNLLVRDGGLPGVVRRFCASSNGWIDTGFAPARAWPAPSSPGNVFAGAWVRRSFLPVSPARSAVRWWTASRGTSVCRS